jgi:hypothetical protein
MIFTIAHYYFSLSQREIERDLEVEVIINGVGFDLKRLESKKPVAKLVDASQKSF